MKGYSGAEFTYSVSCIPSFDLEGDVHRTEQEQPQFVIFLGTRLWNISHGLLVSLSSKHKIEFRLHMLVKTLSKGKKVLLDYIYYTQTATKMSYHRCSKILSSTYSSSFCRIGFNSSFGVVLYCTTAASFYPSEIVSERSGLFQHQGQPNLAKAVSYLHTQIGKYWIDASNVRLSHMEDTILWAIMHLHDILHIDFVT